MKPDDRKKLRDLKLHSIGYKVLETWAEKQVVIWTNMLIEENDEVIRGKIKGMKAILNKVNQMAKKQD